MSNFSNVRFGDGKWIDVPMATCHDHFDFAVVFRGRIVRCCCANRVDRRGCRWTTDGHCCLLITILRHRIQFIRFTTDENRIIVTRTQCQGIDGCRNGVVHEQWLLFAWRTQHCQVPQCQWAFTADHKTIGSHVERATTDPFVCFNRMNRLMRRRG